MGDHVPHGQILHMPHTLLSFVSMKRPAGHPTHMPVLVYGLVFHGNPELPKGGSIPAGQFRKMHELSRQTSFAHVGLYLPHGHAVQPSTFPVERRPRGAYPAEQFIDLQEIAWPALYFPHTQSLQVSHW
jgi:hypothetical protein